MVLSGVLTAEYVLYRFVGCPWLISLSRGMTRNAIIWSRRSDDPQKNL